MRRGLSDGRYVRGHVIDVGGDTFIVYYYLLLLHVPRRRFHGYAGTVSTSTPEKLYHTSIKMT